MIAQNFIYKEVTLPVISPVGLLMRTVGAKATILIGLVFEMLQLAWYGFGSQMWYVSMVYESQLRMVSLFVSIRFARMMWSAGVLAAISSISYPAISAFVSTHADADKQGLVQVCLAIA